MASTSSGACCYYNSRCSLPSAWEPRVAGMRNQHAMQYLKVDGTRVRYVGPGTDDLQAATIRANYPLPADCPLYYFEIKVLDRGQEGFIGVGFCTDEVQLARLPGWDPHSYGYHGDDGHAFSGSGVGRPYGPTYTTGDVIGTLYNKAERTISYYKNGEPLGVAFSEVQEASPLYPCVGLRTRGEEVVANFGTGAAPEPFRMDFQSMRANFQQAVMASVRRVQLPLLSSRGTALLPQLMYDYLLHQRYWRTAAVLARDLLRSDAQLDERELSDIAVRQQTYDMVASGRIDEALTLLQEKYPAELLADRPSLDFRLRLQKFVEMVAAATSAPSAPVIATTTTTASAAAATSPGAATAEATCGGADTSTGAGSGAGAGPASERVQARTAGASSAGATDSADGAAEEADGCAPMDVQVDGGGGGRGGGGGGETHGTQELNGGASAADAAGPTSGSADSDVAVRAGGKAGGEQRAAPTTREILAYGTSELRPRCRTPNDRDLLTDALSLLAFDDPATSPAGYLLRPAHRVALAEELNGAMLACRGLPATSPLERVYQQTVAVVADLKRLDHPQALVLPDPRTMLQEPLAPLAAGGGEGGGRGPGGSGGERGNPMSL